jgi:hypothetical protein
LSSSKPAPIAVASSDQIISHVARFALPIIIILKGEKREPGDLAVWQPTFIVNLTAAKAIGLTIPFWLQVLADVIE